MSIVSLSSVQFLLSSEILVDKSALLNPKFGAFIDRYGPALQTHGRTITLLPATKVLMMTSFQSGQDWLHAKKALAILAKNKDLFSDSSFDFHWEDLLDANELEEIIKYIFVDLPQRKTLMLITSDFSLAQEVNRLQNMKLWNRTVLLYRFRADGMLHPIFSPSRDISEMMADGKPII